MRSRLFALLVVMTAAPAFARGAARSGTTQSCEQKCVETKDECGGICTQYAGGKGAAMCKKGCGEGEKKCQDKCKKRK